MAKCARCGAVYQDGLPYCPNCGLQERVQPPAPPPVYVQQPPVVNPYYVPPVQPLPPYNGMAIAGFVLSCVSMVLCCFPITALIGLILSIVSMPQISKNGERGNGLAIAGLILNGLIILFWVVMLLLSFTGAYMEGFYY